MLEALLAVRALRTDRGGGLDRVYLGNLGCPSRHVFSERQFDPELLPHAVSDLIQDLRRGAASPKDVVFAGRNLYVALRDEAVSDIVALNRSLTPFLGTLFRLAARGHWIRERRRLRAPGDLQQEAQVLEAIERRASQVAASVANDGELDLILTMRDRGARYPFERYPEIREFEAMLQRASSWTGLGRRTLLRVGRGCLGRRASAVSLLPSHRSCVVHVLGGRMALSQWTVPPGPSKARTPGDS